MTSFTCKECGKQAAEGARFCVHCGAQVSDPGAETLVVEDESDILLRSVRRELADEYQLERELGRGGMAIVYEAVDVQLGRRVALKVLPPEMAMRKSMAERFKREAKMAAALDHPNIVPVYRVGQSGGLLYIAMKYIKGRALDSILESQGPLQVPVVLLILRSAASALAYAHERGIVHRDVKSANIMIDTDGNAVVSDFGIARAVEEPNITATGTVVGTPYFMSPEQCAARRIGPQSDQYSLGVVAFQMLTGTVPFSADTLPGIMHHHFYTAVPNVRTSRPEVPEALQEIINRMLAKKSEQRYASTEALATAIKDIPLSDADRRDGERLLRDLAGGATAPRVAFDTLPPLLSSVHLTPIAGGPTIRTAIRRRLSQPVVAIAGAMALATVAGTGWWLSSREVRQQSGETTIAGALAGDSSLLATASAPLVASSPSPISGTASQPTAVATGRGQGASPPATTSAAARLGESNADSSPLGRAASPPASLPPSNPAGNRASALPPGGKIRIRAEPINAAEIWVDDRLLGTGVVVDSVLPVGTRRLKIVAPGFDTYEATFEIVSGEINNLGVVPLRPRGELQ